MKTILTSIALISGLLLLGTPSVAQEYAGASVVHKIRDDISYIQSVNPVLSEGERYSLSQINRDLDELQADRTAGKDYDQAFDRIVYTLQSAVKNNLLSRRDREIMQEDLNLLRGTTFADTQVFAK